VIQLCENVIKKGITASKFKTVSIGAVICMPLERKFVTYNALLPGVMRRGCARYNTLRKINAKTDDMFGSVFDAGVIKKGEWQIIQFYIEFINKNNILSNAVEFLSEVITKPLIEKGGFKKEFVDTEKENLKSEIMGRKNNKKEYAKLKCIEIMCENEPFGIYGDGYIEDLEKINEKNLYEHYCNVIDKYALEFYYVGNVSESEIQKSIDKYFDISVKDSPVVKENIVFSKKNIKNINEVREEAGLSQGKLCMGIRTDVKPNSDDFYRLLAANEIFGGSASSKLFLKLREQNGLCYYINSFVYRFKTIISVQAGIKKEDFEKSVSLIKKCIEEVKNGDFEKKDFENAVSGLIKKYQSISDYPSGLMDFYLSQNIIESDISLDDFIKKLKNVSKSDVSDVMRKIYIDTIYFLC